MNPRKGIPSIHSTQRPHFLLFALLHHLYSPALLSFQHLANTMHLIGSKKKSASKSFDGLGLASGWSFLFRFLLLRPALLSVMHFLGSVFYSGADYNYIINLVGNCSSSSSRGKGNLM